VKRTSILVALGAASAVAVASGMLPQAQAAVLVATKPPGLTALPFHTLRPAPGLWKAAPARSWFAGTSGRTVSTGEASSSLRPGLVGQPSTGISPADVGIAVGKTYIVETTNSWVQVFDRSGTSTLSESLESFFPSALFCVDPQVIYWRWDDRYALVCTDSNGVTAPKVVRFAVSATGNPNGAWYKYTVPETATSGANGVDQPSIEATTDKIIIGGNYYGYKFYVYQKSDLLAGATSPRHKVLAETLDIFRAAVPLTKSASGYFVRAVEGTTPLLQLAKITGTPATGVHLKTFQIAEPGVTYPPVPTVPGGFQTYLDARVHNAVFETESSDGKPVIQFAQTVACGSNDCTASSRLDLSVTPPVLRWTHNDGEAGYEHSWGAVILDKFGHDLAVYSRSNGTQPTQAVAESAAFAQVIHDGTPGTTVCDPTATPPCGQRWGDYLGVAQDPLNPSLVWFAGEYQASSGQAGWGTVIASATETGTL
jgi:hypothetical protein